MTKLALFARANITIFGLFLIRHATSNELKLHATCNDIVCPVKAGEALLQVSKSLMFKQNPRDENKVSAAANASVELGEWKVLEVLHKPESNGTEPLTEEGFKTVQACCCTAAMMTFIRRLIQSEGNGRDVCNEGGLAGLAIWYDCTDDDPSNDFEALKSQLATGSPSESGDCPWIGYPSAGCPPMSDSCPGVTDPDIIKEQLEDGCASRSTSTTPPLPDVQPHISEPLATSTLAPITIPVPSPPSAPSAPVPVSISPVTLSPSNSQTTTLPLSEKPAADGDEENDNTSPVAPHAAPAPPSPIPASEDSSAGDNEGKRATLVCCSLGVQYSTVAPYTESKSNIKPWDCEANSLPVQVLTSPSTGQFYNISSLNVTTGQYNALYQIPLQRTVPLMSKHMNSIAINPIDGIPYATIKVRKVNYIVRFDADNFEFVAQVAPLYEFSKVTQKKMNVIFLGAFGESGAYFLGGRSENVDTDVIAIKDIHKMQGYTTQDAEKLPVLTIDSHGVSYSRLPGKGGDFVVITGDFDKSGDTTEWLFMMDNDFSLSIAKIMDSDVRNWHTWLLKQDIAGIGHHPHVFGAGWSYQNEVYFARNSGEGVFHVLKESLDLINNKFAVAKRAESIPTNKNDGMNCMTKPSPFHGNCTAPEYEVGAVDGQCPSGARAQ